MLHQLAFPGVLSLDEFTAQGDWSLNAGTFSDSTFRHAGDGSGQRGASRLVPAGARYFEAKLWVEGTSEWGMMKVYANDSGAIYDLNGYACYLRGDGNVDTYSPNVSPHTIWNVGYDTTGSRAGPDNASIMSLFVRDPTTVDYYINRTYVATDYGLAAQTGPRILIGGYNGVTSVWEYLLTASAPPTNYLQRARCRLGGM